VQERIGFPSRGVRRRSSAGLAQAGSGVPDERAHLRGAAKSDPRFRVQRMANDVPDLFFRGGLIHQQNGNIVAHGIDALALNALQTLAIFLLDQRFFADRANQNFKKILWNHAGILRYLRPPRRIIGWLAIVASPFLD
jgi:hypothetical protein